MARKYTVVEIDGKNYELHGVKVDKKPIGFVPVRQFDISTGDDFQQFVIDSTEGEIQLIIDDYKYGLAVRLQQMARKSVTGEWSDAKMNEIWPTLTDAEKSLSYNEIVKLCKAKWAEQQAAGASDIDENYVWETLL